MSVENPDVIDVIGTDRETGAVVLTISDHLEWTDDHLLVLQAKLNGYLAFVSSGQLFESHPNARTSQVQFEVVYLHPLNGRGERFFVRACSELLALGIQLTYKPLPDGY